MSVCKNTFSIRSFIKARISLAHNAGHDYLSCGKGCWKLYRWEQRLQSTSYTERHSKIQEWNVWIFNANSSWTSLTFRLSQLQIPVLQQIYGIIVGPATRYLMITPNAEATLFLLRFPVCVSDSPQGKKTGDPPQTTRRISKNYGFWWKWLLWIEYWCTFLRLYRNMSKVYTYTVYVYIDVISQSFMLYYNLRLNSKSYCFTVHAFLSIIFFEKSLIFQMADVFKVFVQLWHRQIQRRHEPKISWHYLEDHPS